MHGIVLALALNLYPFVLLMVVGALRALDQSLEEAAQGLGSSPWRVFWTITVPVTLPSMLGGALLVFLMVASAMAIQAAHASHVYNMEKTDLVTKSRGVLDRLAATCGDAPASTYPMPTPSPLPCPTATRTSTRGTAWPAAT